MYMLESLPYSFLKDLSLYLDESTIYNLSTVSNSYAESLESYGFKLEFVPKKYRGSKNSFGSFFNERHARDCAICYRRNTRIYIKEINMRCCSVCIPQISVNIYYLSRIGLTPPIVSYKNKGWTYYKISDVKKYYKYENCCVYDFLSSVKVEGNKLEERRQVLRNQIRTDVDIVCDDKQKGCRSLQIFNPSVTKHINVNIDEFVNDKQKDQRKRARRMFF